MATSCLKTKSHVLSDQILRKMKYRSTKPWSNHPINHATHLMDFLNCFASIFCPFSCATGYEKNKITNKCVDINECENGDATCDPDKQACYNTMGSYKCLEILPTDETHCDDGFRYNARINQCTGKTFFFLKAFFFSTHKNKYHTTPSAQYTFINFFLSYFTALRY